MKYTQLGHNGPTVSQIGIGTAGFGAVWDDEPMTDEETAHESLSDAEERGITYIDTANNYGLPSGASEEIIGRWLADVDRSRFVLASKAGQDQFGTERRSGYSRRNLRYQIEQSLERLQTDYLDVFYLHDWPGERLEEALRTVTTQIEQGSVNDYGICNLTGWQFMKVHLVAERNGLIRPSVAQVGLNTVTWEEHAELIAACEDRQTAISAHTPLHGGFLTGKYTRESEHPDGSRAKLKPDFGTFSQREWDVLNRVSDVAAQIDATETQVALSWLLGNWDAPVVPVTGVRSTTQLKENIGAVDVELTDDQRTHISPG